MFDCETCPDTCYPTPICVVALLFLRSRIARVSEQTIKWYKGVVIFSGNLRLSALSGLPD